MDDLWYVRVKKLHLPRKYRNVFISQPLFPNYISLESSNSTSFGIYELSKWFCSAWPLVPMEIFQKSSVKHKKEGKIWKSK